MELKLSQEFLTENDCYQAGRKIVPKGIMVHSTGVAQPDPQVFIRRWNKPGVEVCVHAFVARDEVIQTLPWNWRGWHAGSGKNGSANNTHINHNILINFCFININMNNFSIFCKTFSITGNTIRKTRSNNN